MRITVEKIRKVVSLHRKMCGLATTGNWWSIDSQETDDYHFARQELISYLQDLDYEEVLELEVLMDFGRAWYHHVEPEYDENYDEPIEPFFVDIWGCFGNFKQYVGKPDGKDMAILYLIGKAPLAQYLQAALLHCNIDAITFPL